MKITDTIKYVGVNDHQVDLFEGQYPVPNGMCYNSYVIRDEKIAVMDTVDQNFTHEWLDNVQKALNGRKPDYLIVVDALAARSVRRLGRTIQITDTGIYPGSGVGNHRYSITKETTGIPVIAIGIPTVVEAATIVYDSMSALIDELAHAESLQPLKTSWNRLTEAEHRNLVRELLSPQLNHMFVTPKDVDETVRYLSFTISEGLNLAFSDSLIEEDRS